MPIWTIVVPIVAVVLCGAIALVIRGQRKNVQSRLEAFPGEPREITNGYQKRWHETHGNS
jgi:hypothetical protein